MDDIIYGKNTVRDTLKNSKRIEKIFVIAGECKEIVALARDKKVAVSEVTKQKLADLCGGGDANHQGIAAQVSAYEYCEVEDILACAKEAGEPPFILILDGITDVHNYGSIIRSAEVFGVHGIIVGKHRSAPLNAAVCKAASGAAENMRIAKVTNLNKAIETLKENDVWVYCGGFEGQAPKETNLSGAVAIVIGSEGEGVSRLVKENCDVQLCIPMYGRTDSLNASVAAAILLYEKKRQ